MAEILGVRMTKTQKNRLAEEMHRDIRLKKIYNNLSRDERREVIRNALKDLRRIEQADKVA